MASHESVDDTLAPVEVLHKTASVPARSTLRDLLKSLVVEIYEYINPFASLAESHRHYTKQLQQQKEIRRIQADGGRVANSLWYRKYDRNTSREAIRLLLIASVMSVATAVFMTRVFVGSLRSSALPRVSFYPDILLLAAMFSWFMTALCGWCALRQRWVRLRSIRAVRRRFTPGAASAQARRDAYSHSTIRHLALLAGIAVYAAFLVPAASPVGNWPHTLAVISAAIGHARVLPIVLFPVLAEIVARYVRRRRRIRSRLNPQNGFFQCQESMRR